MAEVVGKLSMISWKFEWTIDNFFSYTPGSPRCIRSPDYTVGNTKWSIRLYPHGNAPEFKDHISVYLVQYDNKAPMTAEYRIGIKASDNTIGFGADESCLIGYGFAGFIKRTRLLRRQEELVPSGILTIICFLQIKNAMTSLETRHKKLAGDLKDLYYSKALCDLTLHVNDHTFEAHTCVLSARSSVFAAMFKNNMLEKQTGTVNISDADPEAFNFFLTFLYSGEIEFSNCNVFELYKISDKYDVSDLSLLCANFMIENLSVENFCETLLFSQKFMRGDLYAEIEYFFNKNFKNIVLSDNWIPFMESNALLCNELLKSLASKVEMMDCDK